MGNYKPVTSPQVAYFKLLAKTCLAYVLEIEKMSHVPYSSAVGSFMYAMVCTRPNSAYAVSVVSHYIHNPDKDHWQAVKWILHYLKCSLDRCLVFDKSKTAPCNITGFIDSSHGGDLDRKNSTLGYIFTLCTGAISYKASLQPLTALSTSEAEYIITAEGVMEATCSKYLLIEFGVSESGITVFSDS